MKLKPKKPITDPDTSLKDFYTGEPIKYGDQNVPYILEVVGICPECQESKLLRGQNGYCKECVVKVTARMAKDRWKLSSDAFDSKYGYGHDDAGSTAKAPKSVDQKSLYKEKKDKAKKRK